MLGERKWYLIKTHSHPDLFLCASTSSPSPTLDLVLCAIQSTLPIPRGTDRSRKSRFRSESLVLVANSKSHRAATLPERELELCRLPLGACLRANGLWTIKRWRQTAHPLPRPPLPRYQSPAPPYPLRTLEQCKPEPGAPAAHILHAEITTVSCLDYRLLIRRRRHDGDAQLRAYSAPSDRSCTSFAPATSRVAQRVRLSTAAFTLLRTALAARVRQSSLAPPRAA
ncbi:hypothetical protein DFH08DRAFT_967989 [Mycena albidolilacea]|uniref:Uncharacterized protein n=1 Tax=Mycena albidolilacea TaxID=1033008 RepID=A0AAD6ZL19_9AGAR|nr:hypothetical protein DFH08DRAFT_967989 [Mycena albidolilacea]